MSETKKTQHLYSSDLAIDDLALPYKICFKVEWTLKELYMYQKLLFGMIRPIRLCRGHPEQLVENVQLLAMPIYYMIM